MGEPNYSSGSGQSEPAPPAEVEIKLKAERIQALLRENPGWGVVRGGTAICRTYALPSHRSMLAFVQLVTELAHDHGLTADLDLRQGRVTVTLVSRAARGLTLAVFELARAIDNRE